MRYGMSVSVRSVGPLRFKGGTCYCSLDSDTVTADKLIAQGAEVANAFLQFESGDHSLSVTAAGD